MIGGKSLKQVVAGLLRQLLTVPLQRRYNWCGQKGKQKFGSLKLATVVCRKYIILLTTLHKASLIDACASESFLLACDATLAWV